PCDLYKVGATERFGHRLSPSQFVLHLGRALRKVLPGPGRDLAVRHLVHRLDADDASAETFFSKTRLELTLGLTRTEYQNRVGLADARDDLFVILVEMAGEPPIALVLRRVFLGRAGV